MRGYHKGFTPEWLRSSSNLTPTKTGQQLFVRISALAVVRCSLASFKRYLLDLAAAFF